MPGVAIVGLHRGGTSAVAGVVYNLGAYMGDSLLPPSEYNPRGYFEDEKIVALHDRIIGGNWMNPQTYYPYKLVREYIDAIEKFRAYDLWAIKDPRLCYCLPGLLEIAPETRVISVYRDPWYAAHSVASRNGIHFNQSINIAINYLENMIKNTWHVSRRLRVRYTDIITDPSGTVDTIANFIGVEATDSAIESVDPSLAHWERIDAQNITNAGVNNG